VFIDGCIGLHVYWVPGSPLAASASSPLPTRCFARSESDSSRSHPRVRVRISTPAPQGFAFLGQRERGGGLTVFLRRCHPEIMAHLTSRPAADMRDARFTIGARKGTHEHEPEERLPRPAEVWRHLAVST
jgi:hypothetical protein